MGDDAASRAGLHAAPRARLYAAPRSAMSPRAFRISQHVPENPRTFSLLLEAIGADDRLEAQPGQFVMLWLPGVDEKPFSIAGVHPLMLTISRVGPLSQAIADLPVGEKVWVRGPFGKGYSLAAARTLLVGGGYGAAPLHFLASVLRSRKVAVEIALGARASDDLLFVKRFAALGIPCHLATEDGSRGARGRVTEVVRPLLASGGFGRLCACGPEAMLEALADLCRESRIPAELSYEAYMRCGIGICGSCECRHGLVCRDGPVFSLEP